MMKVCDLLLCSVLFFSVHCIHVSTGSLDEVYSGPQGVVNEPWDLQTDSPLITQYYSVIDFIIGRSVQEDYYSIPFIEKFEAPELTIIEGGEFIEPILFGDASDGFFFEEGNFFWEELPELSIYFNCKANGIAVLSLSVESSVLVGPDRWDSETIEFFFQKECFSPGHRDGFSVGHGESTENVVKHGVVQKKWEIESEYFVDSSPAVFDSDVHSSTFYISISNSMYGNQYFGEPQFILEDDEMMDIQLRGNAASGGVASGMVESLVLFYDCKQEGNTQVTIKIPLEFFGVLEFAFSKVCAYKDLEGAMPGIINVGEDRDDFSGIVRNSVTSSDWTKDHMSITVPSEDIMSNFYVSTESGMMQEILAPLITVQPATAFKVTVSGNIRSGGIVTGSPQTFTINYICDRVSEGTVTVSLKMPHADTVEFSYTKQCKALRRHTEKYWTANQILVFFILIVSAISVALYSLYKKQNSPKRQNNV